MGNVLSLALWVSMGFGWIYHWVWLIENHEYLPSWMIGFSVFAQFTPFGGITGLFHFFF